MSAQCSLRSHAHRRVLGSALVVLGLCALAGCGRHDAAAVGNTSGAAVERTPTTWREHLDRAATQHAAGDDVGMRTALEAALAACAGAGGERARAERTCLGLLAGSEAQRGDFAAAEARYRAAIQLNVPAASPNELADVRAELAALHDGLARTLFAAQRLAGAEAHLREALVLREGTDEVAMAAATLAQLLSRLERPAEAAPLYRRALAAWPAPAFAAERCAALHGLAMVSEAAAAASLLDEALALADAAKISPVQRAALVRDRCLVDAASGDPVAAIARCATALDALIPGGDPERCRDSESAALLLDLRVRLAVLVSDLPSAVPFAEQRLGVLAREGTDRQPYVAALHDLSSLCAESGDIVRALRHAESTIAILARTPQVPLADRVAALRYAAELQRRRGAATAAADYEARAAALER